jgi:hypothetical protein
MQRKDICGADGAKEKDALLSKLNLGGIHPNSTNSAAVASKLAGMADMAMFNTHFCTKKVCELLHCVVSIGAHLFDGAEMQTRAARQGYLLAKEEELLICDGRIGNKGPTACQFFTECGVPKNT